MRSLCLLLSFSLGAVASDKAVPPSPCYPVSSDWIYARDVAPAIPEFSKLPPDLKFGYAPAAGVGRIVPVYDLKRIAKQYELNAAIQKNVCFEWPVAALENDRVMAAMRTSLIGHEATIEILDHSKAAAPPGEVVFPLQGLTAFSEKPVIWNGYVAYTKTRRFSTWALVRVRVSEQRLVAAKYIRGGEFITPDMIKSDHYEGPMLREKTIVALPAGSETRASRDIAPGTIIVSNMLALPDDVRRGDAVIVVVDSGAAHIEAQGLATQAGSSGDIILVKNPRSGSLFKARVLEKGRVSVIPGLRAGLVGEENKL